MRILIIGGTGFIGSWVARFLVAQGHTLALFHRGRTSVNLPPAILHIHGERQSLSAFGARFRRFAPDVVLDMFPYGEQDAALVMKTFCGLAGRIVAVSSMDVYRAYGRFCRLEDGSPERRPFAEDAPLRTTLYPYRASAEEPSDLEYNYDKILVERAVMGDAKLPGTVLRLAKVYGPGDPKHHVFEFLKRMVDRRPFILLGEGRAQWRWTRGYVENVAAAISLAATDGRATGRIYNVGEPEAPTEFEWVQRIGKSADWTGIIKGIPPATLPAHLELPYDYRHHLVADTSRIRRELSYRETISLEEAIRRTVTWERAHPPRQIDPSRFAYAAEDAAYAETGP
jgi:nucleoside-diphosphate-sugar epimerase